MGRVSDIFVESWVKELLYKDKPKFEEKGADLLKSWYPETLIDA